MHCQISGFFRFWVGLVVSMLLAKNATAQEKDPLIIGGAFQQGMVIVHTPKIRQFAGTKPSGIEINLQRQTIGNRYWQQLYRYPRLGLSVVYLHYQNPVLGQSLAVSPYLSLPVMRRKNDEIYFRFGTGLAYFTNNY
ncbi:MAG: hypothetical protein JWQ14_3624, partial [Adhaeribacter sp.]|nr:hypothetical protein [Adhaeribacter sp.]